MKLFRFAIATLLLAAVSGCGAPKPAAMAKPDTTAGCCDAGICASCSGSDSVGAVCDTTLDTTAAASNVVQPDTQNPESVKKTEPVPAKPKPEPTKVAEKPKELPKMWDFGSEKCIPCKTMLEILTPMMADYRGRVDVRIINVYEDKERAQQFRIVTIPTQVFIDAAGKELFRHVGVYPRDSIEARFKQYGFID